MKVTNKAARLITLDWEGNKYRLMPAGNPVDVPDSAMKSVFLNALIDSGDVSVRKMNKADSKAAKKAEEVTEAAAAAEAAREAEEQAADAAAKEEAEKTKET